MTAVALQPVLPWSGLLPEDRTFWRIFTVVMGVFLAICTLVASVSLPLVEPEVKNEMPPRVARILADRAKPRRTESVTAAKTRAPKDRLVKKDVPKTAIEQTVARPSARERPQPPSPVQQATASGVLAMGELLSELRQMAPKSTLTGPTIQGAAIDSASAQTASSGLPADVAGGSAGIESDTVSTRDVLGAGTLLSEDVLVGYGPVASESSGSMSGSASTGALRKGRSQEEIQTLLDRSKSRMYRAYNRALSDDPALRGKIVVRFTIAPAGRVTQCRIVYSDLKNGPLEEELIRIIRGIDFGAKPEVPAVTTKIPIEFFPT